MATTPITTTQQRAIELNVLATKQRSLWQDALQRLVRNKAAMAGLFVLVLAALLALLAPWVSPYDPVRQDSRFSLFEPIWVNSQYTTTEHVFGTDQLGRDTLSRLIWSARISMVVGFIPTAIVFSVGIVVGLAAGYYGGIIDQILMRITDVVYSFPDFLFLLIVVAVFRNTGYGQIFSGLLLIFTAFAVVGWVGVARLTRGQVLSLKEREFVEAARAIGATPARIMRKHLLPNSLAPLLVSAAFTVPAYIIFEATLSFLGVGIKPPTPSWGSMAFDGFATFTANPWGVLLPALCISIVMLSFTFFGDGVRDALDPRMKL